jgi:hypothetical protein
MLRNSSSYNITRKIQPEGYQSGVKKCALGVGVGKQTRMKPLPEAGHARRAAAEMQRA